MEEVINSAEFTIALTDSINGLNNENFMTLNSDKIYEYKENIFDEMKISGVKRDKIRKSLEGYRYIDDINDFNPGEYIRWINISKNEEFVLSRGAFITEIAIHNEDVHVKCKICSNFRQIYMQIKGAENIIFQRLSTQEKIILSALDYVNKI